MFRSGYRDLLAFSSVAVFVVVSVLVLKTFH